MKLSPFSLQHDWKLDWTIIPDSINVDNRVYIQYNRERNALIALASVGLMTKNQLMKIFRLDEKQVRAMEKRFLILGHKLIRNKSTKTTLYTLNVKGAIAIKLDNYKPNYWLQYFPDDVLKRIIFFQTYENLPRQPIIATPSPFVGGIDNGGAMIYVYISKGNNDDLIRYLKFEQQTNQRIVLVVETLGQLRTMEEYIKKLRVRVVIENDLLKNENIDTNIFYTYKDGKLIR